MIRPCQHCGELILGDAYRVTSEEDGVPLLNMVVCSPCAMEAKRLQLHTEAINPSVQYPLFKMEGVGVRGSGFNAFL
jgi:hypothetical protein